MPTVALAPDVPPAAELLRLTALASRLGHQDLRASLQSVTDTGVHLTGAQFGAFFSTDADALGDRLDLYVLSGAPPGSFGEEVPVRHTALFAPTFSGLGVVRIDDVLADARYGTNASGGVPASHVPVRSYLAVPVAISPTRVIGALLFGHGEPGRFGEDAEVAATAVAAHAATAVENARLLGAAERARADAETSAGQLALLQRITALLSTAASTGDIVGRVPAAVTAALGCAGTHVLLVDPASGGLAGDLSDVLAPAARAAWATVPLDSGGPSARAVRERRPVLVPAAQVEGLDGALAAGAPPIGAWWAVPLLDRQRQPLGVLSTLWSCDPSDLGGLEDLLGAVAGQVAQALERTRLFDAERDARSQLVESVSKLTDLARTLQRSLLPRTLPALERVAVAVRYLPAVSGAEAGGDWYDVVDGGDGVVTFVIGDVQGHNTTAAGLMGQLRVAVSAYVAEGHDPATALARTNAVLVGMDAELFATCCLLQLDQRTGELAVASAGHFPPLVVDGDGDGRVRRLDVEPGLPLGVLCEEAYTSVRGRLDAGARVVLHTDGVVESPTGSTDPAGSTDRGLAAVCEALRRHRGDGCEVLADAVIAGIPHRLADDAALLVLDYAGPSAARDRASVVLPPVLASVARARHFLREVLARWDVGAEVAESAELVASELVTNAVTHTATVAELEVAREGAEGVLVLRVADLSTRHPSMRLAAPEALDGRGMAIVEAVAESWGVTAQGAGKVVWARLRA